MSPEDCVQEFSRLKQNISDPALLHPVVSSGSIRADYETMRGIGILPEISEEMLKWRDECVGLPSVCLLHLYLIIAIRRQVDLDDNIQMFRHIWKTYSIELAKHLSLKWLISAADTIVDHPEDPAEEGYALATILFAKTVKVYETEIRAKNAKTLPVATKERTILFDGYLNYAINGGDLIGNMEKRINNIQEKYYAITILREVFSRILRYDTAFTRIR